MDHTMHQYNRKATTKATIQTLPIWELVAPLILASACVPVKPLVEDGTGVAEAPPVAVDPEALVTVRVMVVTVDDSVVVISWSLVSSLLPRLITLRAWLFAPSDGVDSELTPSPLLLAPEVVCALLPPTVTVTVL
jgi:hypothetical protein